jgi:hypothetical protein
MGLRDRGASERFAPVLVVALRAGQVELSLAPEECRAPGLEKRLALRVTAISMGKPRDCLPT